MNPSVPPEPVAFAGKPRVVSIAPGRPRVVNPSLTLDNESERFIHDIFDASINHPPGAPFQSKLFLDETRVDSTEPHYPTHAVHNGNGPSHVLHNVHAGHSDTPHSNGPASTHNGRAPAPGILGRVAGKLFGRRHTQ